ncbi:amidohydrolase family protein [Telmatocola sphagniphila]|uniref:Amidohydrolase family protein n=1 Tax=Telmatocola sphagniphila TaxID=1123043 RepID=A0A8E6ESU9_9BACT|nr:amidohydrolase family protein [Telmatocola sphagniphila]QVL31399.1 amidohydrolase family protein [Telmatocola sphagniphila]
MKFPIHLCASLLLFPAATSAQEAIAYKAAHILTAAGDPIDKGVLIVQKGKILAVGKAAEVKLPAGTQEVDLGEATLIPGLVDTHSHIGIYSRPGVPANSDGNEMSGPFQPGIRALDAIDPHDPGIRMATAGGVTVANIMPGSGNVIGGQTLYVKLRGDGVEAMRIASDTVLGGLKMANGENPKGYGRRGQAPFTRMKVASLQRDQFVKAREYQKKWQAYKDKVAKGEKAAAPEVDASMEPLVEVLERKRTVHFHSHRSDDIMTAIRISEEFNFELVLQHVTEGYLIADELAKRKIPASLTLIDSPGGKAEVMNLIEENAALLEKAGVLVAINTDDSVTESRFLLRTGSIAVRGGMSEASALKALTINPAKMMHLDNKLGSLVAGRDADFVVLSGAPFSVYTQVLATYIDGVKVFDRANAKDHAYQTGGFALADAKSLPPTYAPAKSPEAAQPVTVSPAKSELNTGTVAIVAGRIHTASGAVINNGVILVDKGVIKAVGPAADVKIPEGVRILTAKEVTPGLIDVHSACGLSGALNISQDQDQDEGSDPNGADLRVLDAFNPNEPLLEFLRREGVTVIHALPGRANVLAGQSGVFRTYAPTAEKAKLKFPAAFLVNLGEVPKSTYKDKGPQTRMGTAALLRTNFTKANNYLAKKAGDEDKRPPRDLKMEGLEPVLKGEIPVYFSAQRADDIGTALRIAEEFKLKPVINLAAEAYLMTDRLASAKVPVVVHPTMQRAGGSMETLNSHLSNAAVLADKNIPITICTAFEGYVPKTRVLRVEMALAMTNGLGADRALKAVTIDAAKLLGIDKEFGSLEVGKRADIVLYDGDPFENTTHVVYTLMDGKVVWDRADYLKLPFARRALPLSTTGGGTCCMGQW